MRSVAHLYGILALTYWAAAVVGSMPLSICDDTQLSCPHGYRLVFPIANADCLFSGMLRRAVNRMCYGQEMCFLELRKIFEQDRCSSRCLHLLVSCVAVAHIYKHSEPSSAWRGFLHSYHYPDTIIGLNSSTFTLVPSLEISVNFTLDIYDLGLFSVDTILLCPNSPAFDELVCKAVTLGQSGRIVMKTSARGVIVRVNIVTLPGELLGRRFLLGYSFGEDASNEHPGGSDVQDPVIEVTRNITWKGGTGAHLPGEHDVIDLGVVNATNATAEVEGDTGDQLPGEHDVTGLDVVNATNATTNVTGATADQLPGERDVIDLAVVNATNATTKVTGATTDQLPGEHDVIDLAVVNATNATTKDTDVGIDPEGKTNTNRSMYIILGGAAAVVVLLFLIGLSLGLLFRRNKRNHHQKYLDEPKPQKVDDIEQTEKEVHKEKRKKRKDFKTANSWSWASWGRV